MAKVTSACQVASTDPEHSLRWQHLRWPRLKYHEGQLGPGRPRTQTASHGPMAGAEIQTLRRGEAGPK